MDPQNIPPQPVQPEPVYQQPSSTRLPLIIGVIVLLFIIGVGGAYYLGTKQITNQQNFTTEPTQTPKVPITPELTPILTTSNPSASISQQLVASLTPDPTANWITYTNQILGFTLKYPSSLFFKEIDTKYGIALTFEPFPDPQVPGSYFDSISIFSDNNSSYGFNILQQAAEGKTGIDIHQACGVIITKLSNKQFGTYAGVEYIYDGTNPPSGCGRDLIGYEHTILIRKNDNEFIKLVNRSMKAENTRQHDSVFNEIFSSLILK